MGRKLTEEQLAQRRAEQALHSALIAEERDRRSEERRKRWVEEGLYLTWDELVAGETCRECGQPWQDSLGSWPVLNDMTVEERAAHDTIRAKFIEQHQDCGGGPVGMSGSRARHCGFCCPPPPMSRGIIDQLSLIFSRPTSEAELDRWQLTLTCSHTAEAKSHRTNQHLSLSVATCDTCKARRGVVHAERIGPAEDPDGLAKVRRLEAEMRAATAKLDRQRTSTSKAENQVAELQTRIDELRKQGH